MTKTTSEIAADCGTDEYTLEQVLNDSLGTSTVMENDLCEMVGALYRRIERLEEENASFIKDLKLQSERLAELETWNEENQGI